MANRVTISDSFFFPGVWEKKDWGQCLKRVVAETFRICKLPTDSANVKHVKEKHTCIAQPHKSTIPQSKARTLK